MNTTTVRVGRGTAVHYGVAKGHVTICGTVSRPGVATRKVTAPVTCAKCIAASR